MLKNLKGIVLTALMLSLIFVGCGKLNRENYDRIKVGMDFQEVVEIIGQPDACDAALGAKSCVWGDKDKNISIKFVADKVALPTMTGL